MGPCFPGTPPPRPLPTSPTIGLKKEEQGSRATGLAEGRRGDTHRKLHCSRSCDSKKHRMPSSPPTIVAATTATAWLTPGRGGGVTCGPKAQPLILDFKAQAHHLWPLLTLAPPPCTAISGNFSHFPLVRAYVPRLPFLGIFFSQSSSNGTSSRKSPPTTTLTSLILPTWVRCPLSAHTASLGFPHHSPDFLDSPPSDWV